MASFECVWSRGKIVVCEVRGGKICLSPRVYDASVSWGVRGSDPFFPRFREKIGSDVVTTLICLDATGDERVIMRADAVEAVQTNCPLTADVMYFSLSSGVININL